MRVRREGALVRQEPRQLHNPPPLTFSPQVASSAQRDSSRGDLASPHRDSRSVLAGAGSACPYRGEEGGGENAAIAAGRAGRWQGVGTHVAERRWEEPALPDALPALRALPDARRLHAPLHPSTRRTGGGVHRIGGGMRRIGGGCVGSEEPSEESEGMNRRKGRWEGTVSRERGGSARESGDKRGREAVSERERLTSARRPRKSRPRATG